MTDRRKLWLVFSHTWLILVEFSQFILFSKSNTKSRKHECLYLFIDVWHNYRTVASLKYAKTFSSINEFFYRKKVLVKTRSQKVLKQHFYSLRSKLQVLFLQKKRAKFITRMLRKKRKKEKRNYFSKSLEMIGISHQQRVNLRTQL